MIFIRPLYKYDIEKLYYKLENKLLINDNEIIIISSA